MSRKISRFSHNRLETATLSSGGSPAAVRRVLAAALDSVEPAAAVRRHLRKEDDMLSCGGFHFPLAAPGRIFVVGAGKAGIPMTRAVVDLLAPELAGGAVIVKSDDGLPLGTGSGRIGPVQILKGDHPVPNRNSVQASGVLLQILAETRAEDLVICLISGGGSALMTHPAPGICLEDLQSLTKQLLASGAAIQEMNTLRKHLDRIKGGGLARSAWPARVLTLILSDVIGDAPDVIASGPTTADPGTFADALRVLAKYDLLETAPTSIRSYLERGRDGEIEETLKPSDPVLGQVHQTLIGSNRIAIQAAAEQARQEGLQPHVLTSEMEGEARDQGRWLALAARRVAEGRGAVGRPACLIAGGETTVTLSDRPGVGGRNQELALAAVAGLAGLDNAILVALATDGDEGLTDAAGAVVSGDSLARAKKLGMDPGSYLDRNDAYHFFDALGDLLKTGPTHTNVNDLALVFLF